jgi:FkbM family methyltransferase
MPMNAKSAGPFKGLSGMAQRLCWRLLTSKSILRYFATRVVTTADTKTRTRLFRLMGEASGADFAYANVGRERYLVNCRDQAISRVVFATGEFELDKLENAIRMLRRHTSITSLDLLVDVGANIGTVCIPAVARGLAQAAVGIEPHPVNCRLLRANIALNSVETRIAVHECAVGAADQETLMLEVSDDNWGDHRIAVTREDGEFGESARRRIPIRSMRLDRLVEARPGQSLLIWMDTQGYEGFVLKGAGALLAARVPIVAEFWPYGMRRAGSYSLFRELLAGYRGFIDLREVAAARQGGPGAGDALYPMSRLDPLHDSLNADAQSYTDLLIV